MITIRCTEEEQSEIISCFAEQHYCVANISASGLTCWNCDKDCVKKHINWEIVSEVD